MAGKSPSQFVSELLEKLAGASRHVSFLLGAGTSKAVGLPDVPELGERVGKDVAAQNEDLGKLYTQLQQSSMALSAALLPE